MAIGAIVQARMGSSRLPGKILNEILGKPMLWHLIKRLERSAYVEKTLIATTTEERDSCIADFARDAGIACFRGSERDVLDRYYRAAREYGFDPIVRITADCPLIDPAVTDKAIAYYLENRDRVDYVCNAGPPTYPDGLDTEVFSFAALERAWKDAKRTSEREYVTTYFWNNKDSFRMANVSHSEDLSRMRWTVDEPKDFLFVRTIFEALYGDGSRVFGLDEIVSYLGSHPEVAAINQGIGRNEGYIKSLKNEGADIEKEVLPWRPADPGPRK